MHSMPGTAQSLQGWDQARDHARSAVETDNRLRRWLPDAGSPGPPAGLLYRCTLGNIDLSTPLGALRYPATSGKYCYWRPQVPPAGLCQTLVCPAPRHRLQPQAGMVLLTRKGVSKMVAGVCACAGLLQASREASMGMMECTLSQHQTDAQVRDRPCSEA